MGFNFQAIQNTKKQMIAYCKCFPNFETYIFPIWIENKGLKVCLKKNTIMHLKHTFFQLANIPITI